ncbi:MAG: hypothetical protein H6Q81_2083, partial [Deltaproteobacteria bacterium]|nr:hypothetical protein [Deltaproteobacteria bacterium]
MPGAAEAEASTRQRAGAESPGVAEAAVSARQQTGVELPHEAGEA